MRSFQLLSRLDPDGLVGVQTLLRLSQRTRPSRVRGCAWTAEMSFILEALKKSERDRQAAILGAEPPVDLRRTVSAAPRRSSFGKTVGLAIGGLAIIAAAIGGWRYLGVSSDSATAPMEEDVSAPPRAKPAGPAQRTLSTATGTSISGVSETPPAKTPAAPVRTPIASNPAQSDEAEPEAGQPLGREREAVDDRLVEAPDILPVVVSSTPMPMPIGTIGPEVEPPLDSSEQAQGVEQERPDGTKPAGSGAEGPVVPEPEEAAAQATPATETAQSPVPTIDLRAAARGQPAAADPLPRHLGRMPFDFQTAVSPLNLQVHVYDDDPGRRFVMINGSDYSEGSEIKLGLRLEQIVSQGAVMSWKGERFLLAPRD